MALIVIPVALIVIPVVCCAVCQVEMMEEHIQNNSEFTSHLLSYNSRAGLIWEDFVA